MTARTTGGGGHFPTRARLVALWRQELAGTAQYPRFLVAASFLATFGGVRATTHLLRRRQSPLDRALRRGGGLQVGDIHIHHMVGGIALLLLTGYVAVERERPHLRERLATLYGVGAALTLDEFALWLRLQDDYWAREGRESVDAGVLAGAAFVVAALGRPFVGAALREWRG
jgi:hypothetical protein